MPQLILASTSPYRRELLARLRLDFVCQSPGVDESQSKARGLSPQQLAAALAHAKAAAVAARHPGAVVIGSDQVCACAGQVLDKPGSADRACRQLAQLAGQTHELITAVAVVHPAGCTTFCDIARLTMRSLSADEIARYVAVDQPLDCAGSYKLESLGITLFAQIVAADQTAIIGLPLLALASALRALGFHLP